MSDTPWWGSLLNVTAGGLIALASQWVVHLRTTKAQEEIRKAEAKAKNLTDLRHAYVTYLAELNTKSRALLDIAHPGQPSEAIRSNLSNLIVRSNSDAYFKLRMLETDPGAAKRIAAIGDADASLIALSKKAQISYDDLVSTMKGPHDAIRDFQDWIFTERFNA